MWIHVYRNWKMNLDSKIGIKMRFSYKTKASKSFIPTMPIMKRKEIIMRIHAYPNRKMNFNSKFARKWCFTYKTKASKSFIPTMRVCLLRPIMKKKRLLCEFMFIPIKRWTSILKREEKEVFLMKTKHQNHLSHQGDCVYGA